MNEDSIELTPDLIEDFYAECEEQLSNARQQLVNLEQSADADPLPALESLFRSVHSFKGNAAIVGLADAERLTHTAETLLRRLTRREESPDPAIFDVLGRVVQRLEQIVGAFRGDTPLPAVEDLVRLLESFDGGSTSPVDPGDPALAPAEESTSDPAQWRASFRPSVELENRGVNINSIRSRLTALGTIDSAKPTIESGGCVRFDFTLSTQDAPDVAAWEVDGVTWERVVAAVPESAEPRSQTALGASSPIVRVNLSRLDELMRIVGELVIQRSRLHDRVAELDGDGTALQDINLGLMRSLRDLRSAIMRVRLVPVVEIFSRMPFVVRDLTRGTDKRARLVIDGEQTEIDKHLVERLKEPLLHLVRNAISHGIETTAERIAAGKPPEATLRLSAEASGDAVQIKIRDDGRGINAAAVAARARAAGLPVPEVLDERALLRLICMPGFSTRTEADRAAGRGVGMNVVDTTLRDLGGSLALATSPGEFSEFTLRLPLTLAIADTFIVTAGEHRCAVPQSSVTEIVQMPAAEIHTLNEAEAGPYRGTLLPVVRLRRLFGLPPAPPREFPVVVVQTEQGPTGLLVDQILGHREVVVRPLHDPLLRVPGVSGATELGDGDPVLILDSHSLSDAAAAARRSPRRTALTAQLQTAS